DAKLGVLKDNGGPTMTHKLLQGSPAIDAGDNTDAPEGDQRGPGYARVVNGTIDIGAYEVQARRSSPPLPSGVPVTPLSDAPTRSEPIASGNALEGEATAVDFARMGRGADAPGGAGALGALQGFPTDYSIQPGALARRTLDVADAWVDI